MMLSHALCSCSCSCATARLWVDHPLRLAFCMQVLFDDFVQHVEAYDMRVKSQQIDPPHVKQGVFGQPHDYEGGFVLLTLTGRQQ